MDYRHKLSEYKSHRLEYFPLIDILLHVESRTPASELPLEMTDAGRIALLLELIDIGYINPDSFIIKKNRGDIRGVFYRGGEILTAEGIKIYRAHLHERRGMYIRGFALLLLVFLIMVVFYMIFK
jgi:hypothetical protein